MFIHIHWRESDHQFRTGDQPQSTFTLTSIFFILPFALFLCSYVLPFFLEGSISS